MNLYTDPFSRNKKGVDIFSWTFIVQKIWTCVVSAQTDSIKELKNRQLTVLDGPVDRVLSTCLDSLSNCAQIFWKFHWIASEKLLHKTMPIEMFWKKKKLVKSFETHPNFLSTFLFFSRYDGEIMDEKISRVVIDWTTEPCPAW